MMMESVLCVCLVIIHGSIIQFLYTFKSYECSGSATYCTSCDNSNTNRTLTTNTCPCKIGYYDNNIKVC